MIVDSKGIAAFSVYEVVCEVEFERGADHTVGRRSREGIFGEVSVVEQNRHILIISGIARLSYMLERDRFKFSARLESIILYLLNRGRKRDVRYRARVREGIRRNRYYSVGNVYDDVAVFVGSRRPRITYKYIVDNNETVVIRALLRIPLSAVECVFAYLLYRSLCARLKENNSEVLSGNKEVVGDDFNSCRDSDLRDGVRASVCIQDFTYLDESCKLVYKQSVNQCGRADKFEVEVACRRFGVALSRSVTHAVNRSALGDYIKVTQEVAAREGIVADIRYGAWHGKRRERRQALKCVIVDSRYVVAEHDVFIRRKRGRCILIKQNFAFTVCNFRCRVRWVNISLLNLRKFCRRSNDICNGSVADILDEQASESDKVEFLLLFGEPRRALKDVDAYRSQASERSESACTVNRR